MHTELPGLILPVYCLHAYALGYDQIFHCTVVSGWKEMALSPIATCDQRPESLVSFLQSATNDIFNASNRITAIGHWVQVRGVTDVEIGS